MNTFLVATDGSPAADAAVEAAVQLADEQEAKVVFLHVVEAIDVIAPPFGPIVASPVPLGAPEEDPPLARAADLARAHGVEFELELVSGFEVDTILATADKVDAELIAVGANRHNPLGTLYFGSVSKELLRRAQRPLLVVHQVPAAVPVPA